jgi:hypothetical protein
MKENYNEEYLDVMRKVLDHELIDVNNIPCGMVDDLEIEGRPGEALKVTAILVGPGAWADRLPGLFGSLAKKIFGSQRTRVPWEEVSIITERIKLKSRASELGLGKADRKAAKLIKRLPGA